METAFTPIQSLLGGVLIGLAAVMLMAVNGRIAGISGIVSRLLPPLGSGNDRAEGTAFVAGLLLALPLWWLAGIDEPAFTLSSSLPLLLVAGFLVGFGSVLGSGCTSGHGVCGLSRLSTRSMVATSTFMLSAAATVYVLRHVLGD